MANIYDVASAIQQPNIVGNFQQGLQTARLNQAQDMQLAQQKQAMADQQTLRGLAPQVVAGDPSAYAQAAALNPDQANAYQSAGDSQLMRLRGAMNYLDRQPTPAAKEAAYQSAVRPYLARVGAATGKIPPSTFAEAEPLMEAARAQLSGLPPPETTTLAPGSELVAKGTGTVLHSTPFADKIINNAPVGPNGERGVIAVNPHSGGQGTIVGLGGAPQVSGASPAFYGAVNDLASKYGATITSGLRSPEHNAEVGGVPNSQHLTGTAADVVIPPDQKQQFIQDAKARGLQPIDEGDHVHLQNPNGGAGITGVRLAIGTPAPKTNSLQQRIDAAKSLGATGDELKGMVLGAGAQQAAQASQLSPDALTNATFDYLFNKSLPPVGRGGQGQAQRTAIMNNAATVAKSLDMSPADFATRAGQQKALQGSLNAYQKRSDAMEGQEQSFLRNLTYAQQISDQIGRTGSPALNKWILGGEANLGDPDVVKLQAALTPVAADYARIMAGSTGAGGTPVSTQQEAMDMLRKELSQNQFNAVADVLRNDIKNQRLGVADQMRVIQARMRGLGNGSLGGTNATNAPTPPTQQAASANAPVAAKGAQDYSHLWGG